MHVLTAGVLSGDILSVARAISLAENHPDEVAALLGDLYQRTGKAVRLGVTGPPGVGKSTLVNSMALSLAAEGERVGIIAVDPSSPFTGGALLGDRIRMQEASSNPSVFIRSMAARGIAGGLARATADASDVLDAAGYAWVLLETVGVGQSEIEVTRHADCTVVVLSPESGDAIQAMKAGLLEAADLVCINKADRPGAERLAGDLRSAFDLCEPRRDVPIVPTEALSGKGVAELGAAVRKFLEEGRRNGRFGRRRLANAATRLRRLVEQRVVRDLWSLPGAESRLEEAARESVEGRCLIHQAARALGDALLGGSPSGFLSGTSR